MKKDDKYAEVAWSSNLDNRYEMTWKLGDTMLDISGKLVSRVERSGSDHIDQ